MSRLAPLIFAMAVACGPEMPTGAVSTGPGPSPAADLAQPATPSDGGVTPSPDLATGPTLSPQQMAIFSLAQSGVGYSYYWGHGSWRSDGTQIGSCVGDCPSCTHTDIYGADCSGYVAKVWQVPSPSPIDVDQHPFSTLNFYNDTTYWAPVARTAIQPADGLVYRYNGAGHIALFESGTDPWGDLWVYEARGCATGIQHDLRPFDSSYKTIRLNGL
jgi:hypothetical protein